MLFSSFTLAGSAGAPGAINTWAIFFILVISSMAAFSWSSFPCTSFVIFSLNFSRGILTPTEHIPGVRDLIVQFSATVYLTTILAETVVDGADVAEGVDVVVALEQGEVQAMHLLAVVQTRLRRAELLDFFCVHHHGLLIYIFST